MKLKLFLFALVLCTSSAFAWPPCSGQWNQVPKGTSHANGAIEITGDNLTFQCQQPKTPTPPTTTNSNTNQNTNTSTSGAKSTSVANATATQGQKQNQGQSQSSDSAATAANNGNNANNSVSNTRVERNTPMAYSPEAIPSAPCIKGYSGGASGASFGLSMGGGKVDEGCAIRETARAFALGGSKLAYCKVLITSKEAKKAGVTLADCLAVPAVVPVPVAEVVPAPVPVPLAVIPELPVEIIPTTAFVVLADCDIAGSTVTNECKARLDTAVLYLRNKGDGFLVVDTDTFTGFNRAKNVVAYLVQAGVNSEVVRTRLQGGTNHGVQVSYSSN